ncbi:Uncharacterised protein [uncultured archaeon]|nr:Uncharacterised protein [uncultured archaeon]
MIILNLPSMVFRIPIFSGRKKERVRSFSNLLFISSGCSLVAYRSFSSSSDMAKKDDWIAYLFVYVVYRNNM